MRSLAEILCTPLNVDDDWVKSFLSELIAVKESRVRALRWFQDFKLSIGMVEQGETLLQELQKECEERKLELQQLKQLVTQNQIGQRTLKQSVELQSAYEREQQLASHLEVRTDELAQQLQQIQLSNSNQRQRSHTS
ncbi:uncharacterized protein LOC115952525 [Quercus lobata]|uniref:uncharacterized protein LOC115952525 n=1 Tax=Quercus lobata TaxID=97700 RepID=UPI0012461045|nr:uncharacterized protein LOC115952525 [Quercus lobata]